MTTIRACRVGQFLLHEHPDVDGKPVIWIGIRAGFDGAGEGGTFPVAEIERFVADYYREHF